METYINETTEPMEASTPSTLRNPEMIRFFQSASVSLSDRYERQERYLYGTIFFIIFSNNFYRNVLRNWAEM